MVLKKQSKTNMLPLHTSSKLTAEIGILSDSGETDIRALPKQQKFIFKWPSPFK